MLITHRIDADSGYVFVDALAVIDSPGNSQVTLPENGTYIIYVKWGDTASDRRSWRGSLW